MSTISKIDIWNQALSAAGAPGRITQENEDSIEREVCERWYENTVRTVQEAAYWPACETAQLLALLGTRDYSQDWAAGDPFPQFKYKFALPSDYLRARYLSDFQPFKLVWSVDRRTLQTNSNAPILIYSRYSEIVTDWTPNQKLATIYGLAFNIGPELTGKRANINRNAELANQQILNARVEAANAEHYMYETIPDWIAARGYAENAPSTRYFFEYGSMFAAGEGGA